jgi:hypothetical protein
MLVSARKMRAEIEVSHWRTRSAAPTSGKAARFERMSDGERREEHAADIESVRMTTATGPWQREASDPPESV